HPPGIFDGSPCSGHFKLSVLALSTIGKPRQVENQRCVS
ncbi:hypothetical protein CEXT_325761, partial [Caerostris extrusa]